MRLSYHHALRLDNLPLPTYRNFDFLIPDAPELIHSYLEGEQDASCKRNAFMMLIHVDRVRSCGCAPDASSQVTVT